MDEKARKTHGEESYHLKKSDITQIEIEDFQNPWTFHTLFMSPDEDLFRWLREKGLLASEIKCTKCDRVCKLYRRSRAQDKFTFRCTKHSGVELGMRKFSFFEGSPYNKRDLMIFIKEYLEGHSLRQCAFSTGMDYKRTAVDWASYVREMFCQYTFDMYNMTQFDGDVEIDESLFGRKIKYNRGEPKGHRIWIFGIVERASNKLILYPVDKRDAQTLIPIIQRHVAVGSRIFSDSWAAYMRLNELGYEHFTVCHKTTFKQTYQSVDTGEIIECQTNQIEGAWKHCKDHFRKINGTNVNMFEQHLSEIIWRNHIQGRNKYVAFFELVKTIYTLDMPKMYTYRKPVFDTWTPPSAEVEKQHHVTILQCSSGSEDEPEVEIDVQMPQASSTPVPEVPFLQSHSPEISPLCGSVSSTHPDISLSTHIRSSPQACTSKKHDIGPSTSRRSSPRPLISKQPEDRFITRRKKKHQWKIQM